MDWLIDWVSPFVASWSMDWLIDWVHVLHHDWLSALYSLIISPVFFFRFSSSYWCSGQSTSSTGNWYCEKQIFIKKFCNENFLSVDFSAVFGQHLPSMGQSRHGLSDECPFLRFHNTVFPFFVSAHRHPTSESDGNGTGLSVRAIECASSFFPRSFSPDLFSFHRMFHCRLITWT